MGRMTLGILALATATATALSACGGSQHFANRPRPASPVNMTVYINDQRVSVSPGAVGAGPVVFIITNQASNAESVAVTSSGGGNTQPLANTGPISPQATAQLSVNLRSPGSYTVGVAPNDSTEAAAATPTGIQSARILVGQPRPNSSNEVSQP
jgi:hypothetical protein